MQTAGDVMSLMWVSLTCVHQQGLFCRVAFEIIVVSSLDTTYRANF